MVGSCCNVSIAQKKESSKSAGEPQARTVVELQGAKPYSDFKITYEDIGLVDKKGSKGVTEVESRDTYGRYVCRKLAIKDMPCKSKDERSKHYQALAGMEHPHICKFVEAFEDKDYAYLIYEKADTTTLFDHVRNRRSLTEEEAADYVRQVTAALAVAHMSGIVHGRLSPRSLILTPGFEEAEEDNCEVQIKVCDFGQGFILRKNVDVEEVSADKVFQMMRYSITPEMVTQDLEVVAEGKESPKGADKCDMWALGVIVYHMLSGRVPFEGANKQALENKITNSFASFDSDMWKKLSPVAQDAVAGLLKVNPGIRLSAQALLRHPWIKVAKQSFPKRRMEQLLTNLRTNAAECEFKKFVLRVIAEYLPPEGKQAAVVESAFRCLDGNGDGVLTVDEIIKGLKKHMDCSSQELSQLFHAVDRDGSGTLNVNEFICVTMDQRKTTSLPVLWQAFNAFDKDQGGAISFDEIDKIVKEVEGALVGNEQVEKLSREIVQELEGVSTAGTIDFEQFVYIMINSKPNTRDAIAKDWSRFLWNRCGVDAHQVRQMPTTWDLTNKAINPRSGRSVYRHKDHNRRQPRQSTAEVTGAARGKPSPRDASPRGGERAARAG